MDDSPKTTKKHPVNKHAITLGLLLVIQVLCAVFFIGDAFVDIHWGGFSEHSIFESIIALALCVGVVFGVHEMRRLMQQKRQAEDAVSIASGALHRVIENYFKRWNLSPAEADVALLAIKGFDIAEISSFRGTEKGTVRAQLAQIYNKAGVTSRPQLLSLFLDELLDVPLLTDK